ncbi:MAG: DNA mismatch repair endonuclease MutL, partial [Kofleriaceae bacterium]|nr:DNA mismatch repair endonuclease MutL [Kofleriaceae bacterium]
MESLIAVLPSTVIDQIAAGEVIERPASVVKELVDNAIDAGARTISIETTAGGRGLVRIVDDGRGMSPRDAVVAFERHATSKLRAVDDIWSLTTMGFRGEALPSIASVSRLVLTTRQQGDLAATRVEFAGGKLVGTSEVGAPVGTTVEVADLLYNVPARLKFLKGEATEASHITELVAKVAMAHPDLHLRLRHNGRVALEVPPDRDAFGRAQALLGTRVATRMVPVNGEEAGIRVTAFLGAPELAQTTARGVQLFVGKRPVRDRGLLHAIAMGYGELVPRGRYPLAIVMVDVPSGAVDVNVHPQKQEVRFSDAGAVAAAVRHVVQSGVERAPWRDEIGGAGPVVMTAIASVAPPKLPFDAPATPLAQTYAAQLREQRDRPWARDSGGAQARLGFDDGPRQWARQIKQSVRTARAAEAELAAKAAYAVARVADEKRQADFGDRAAIDRVAADVVAALGARDEAALDARAPHDEAALAEGSAPTVAPGFFASLRYLGQLDLTYLVCEAEGELVLIDQHVAHERVELARLKGQGDRDIPTQRLLFPTTIEVKPELVEVATRMSGVLAQVGYEAESFGKTTLAVKAVPGGIRHGDPTALLRELLGEWADDGAPTETERLERVLAEIACHSVVRAGDRLSPSEAEALLRSMDGADFSTRGPHGRPVLLRLPLSEIARR